MNDVVERGFLWDDLIGKIVGSNERWIVCGDFNMVLNSKERMSKFRLNIRESEEFFDCVDNIGLVEL